MRYLALSIIVVFLFAGCDLSNNKADYSVDVCIYGGTSAGVIAAYKAKMAGRSVLLIEPGRNLGGLSSGGLGATDIGEEDAVSGLSRDYYKRLGEKYGLDSVAWHFEPGVAEEVFNDYIEEAAVDVVFDYTVVDATVKNTAIQKITLKDYEHGKDNISVNAEVFLDCSYEGDLMALAGVSYTVGRESNQKYAETWNGVQVSQDNQVPDGIDPYIVPGDTLSGLVWGVSSGPIAEEGTGDHKVQAYCYRLCMTTDPDNMIPVEKPENYDSTQFEVLRRIIQQRDSLDWVQRIHQLYLRIIDMPNNKTDVNNKGGFSLSMAGENWNYPEAGYWERKEIAKKIEDYNKGIIYFLGHDPAVPEHVKEQMLQYGWPKDEFVDNNHFPHQLYIRESRRLLGQLVMTEHHCMSREIVEDGIARGSYNMDSHNCDRHVIDGMVVNEGDVQVSLPKPYDISYRSILPQQEECTNLLVPVCLSSSHIAYGSIRMEPVFMMLGEAAGLAASVAVERGVSVADLDGVELKKILGL
ncbi:MAG TPA: FAD-dependent oxidoreductase [Bacteroidales bacterium]|nr:FAD-dependent oxidoreductase [Bacteroidales bacterium]